MLQNFTKAVRDLQHTFGNALNPYRPELYYMRGPGPACRAKAARNAPFPATARVELATAYVELTKAHA
ncbi:MAG: hypothetical protein WB677_14070 [Xanthobacteraceae bacterium]